MSDAQRDILAGLSTATVSAALLIALAAFALLALFARRAGLTAQHERSFTIAAALYLGVWLALAFAAGQSGALHAQSQSAWPAVALALAVATPLIVGWLLLNGAPQLRRVLAAVPAPWFAALQTYRLLGVLFLALYALGRMPTAFALPVGIGETIVGAAAPLVAYGLHRNTSWSVPAAKAWNVFGLAVLALAAVMTFLIAPSALQPFAATPSGAAITSWPYVLFPIFAVPLSILLHTISLQRLRSAAGHRHTPIGGDLIADR